MCQHDVYVPISAEEMNKIRTATDADPKQQTLIRAILQGWTKDKKKDVPFEITHFFSFRDITN